MSRNREGTLQSPGCLPPAPAPGVVDVFSRIYLNVPFAQKEEVKSLGARWDPGIKKWYIDTDNNRRQVVLQKFTRYAV